MEIAGDVERPKSTEGKESVELRVHGSKTKISDIRGPSLLSKEEEEKVIQADKKPWDTTRVKVSEMLERPKLNPMIGPEDAQTTLESTNDSLRPEFKELEADHKQEAASEGWVKKAGGKVAFNSPDNLYFKPNIIEKWGNGKIYELLGVKPFQRIWGNDPAYHHITFHNIMKAQDRKSALKDFEKSTRQAESIRLAGVAMVGVFSVPFYLLEPIAGYYIFFAINLVANFYPIISMRYNRVKVYNLIDKLNARERKNNK